MKIRFIRSMLCAVLAAVLATLVVSPAGAAGSGGCGSSGKTALTRSLDAAGRYVQNLGINQKEVHRYLSHGVLSDLQFLDRASGGSYDVEIWTFRPLRSCTTVRGKPYWEFEAEYVIVWSSRSGEATVSTHRPTRMSIYGTRLYYGRLFGR